MVLEMDFDSYLRENLYSFSSEVKNVLSKNQIRYSKLNATAKNITFTANSTDTRKALFNSNLNDIIKVENIGDQIIISYTEKYLDTLQEKVLQSSITSINRRIDATGTKEALVQSQGKKWIIVQVPGLDDPQQLKNMLGKTAKLTFHFVDNNSSFTLRDKDGHSVKVNRNAELGGDHLIDASVSYNNMGRPIVTFKLSNLGARKFASITKYNVGRQLAIVLDRTILTAPTIKDSIFSGQGEITGQFTVESATELAILLRSGALPAPLKIVEERTVGPSLGHDSVIAGQKASITALILVAIFMILVYKIAGLWAVISLLFNFVILLASVALLNITLTFPGIAGLVLTIGMAVDANVLIFERIKEERKSAPMGSSLTVINNGFQNALVTIVDANATTLISAFIMFFVGTGAVKGFSIMLSLGILSSIFSAIFVTKILMLSCPKLSTK